MKLIVGLGNPGEKYQDNRHNVGFMIIDEIVKKLPVSPHVENKLDSLVFYHHPSGTVFARPETFMNDSGRAVKKLIENWKLKTENLYVIHDDLDIPLGKYKIQKGKGPKVHRGLQSIEAALGTPDFWRVRIGIENRIKNNELRIKGEQYVLQDFTKEEKVILDKVLEKVCQEINLLLQ